MRQAYIEIALIYLYSVGLIKVQDGSFLESVAGDSDGEQSITSGRQSTSLSDRKLKRKVGRRLFIFKLGTALWHTIDY